MLTENADEQLDIEKDIENLFDKLIAFTNKNSHPQGILPFSTNPDKDPTETFIILLFISKNFFIFQLGNQLAKIWIEDIIKWRINNNSIVCSIQYE